MNTKVTIVMYHYVRDLLNSRFPDIKGLDLNLFKEQIFFLKKHYNFITMEQLIDSIDKNISLPQKSVLLTFDDAYIDHYTNVFPVLANENIQGSFFAPVKALTNHQVLDVNKIHFILASCENKKILVDRIFELLNNYREEYNLNTNKYYYEKLAVANRFDTAEVIFIKRLLQVELVEELRNLIADKLFEEFIGMKESSFSRELYMNDDQLKSMIKHGMHIGSHGYDHYFLNSLSEENQYEEIKKSFLFIQSIGANPDYLTLCYPYGAYNETTKSIASKLNCKIGLTTNVDIANFQTENRLTLSRLDTNDLPKNKCSHPNSWYNKI
jgi:peptidoglycan/xylan/chitin deacetylase (PgdA/CDA1 family)